MKQKTMIYLLCLVLCLFILHGCILYSQENNNFETVGFTANYKQKTDLSIGRKSAVYDSFVYYFSDKKIIKMNADGTDKQVLFDTPDIRKLQVTEDSIYYLGNNGKGYNKNGELNIFDLYRYSIPNNFAEKIPVEHGEDEWGYSGDYSLWDFYSFSENEFLISYIHPTFEGVNCAAPYGVNIYYSDVENIIDLSGSNLLNFHLYISKYKDFLISEDSITHEEFEKYAAENPAYYGNKNYESLSFNGNKEDPVTVYSISDSVVVMADDFPYRFRTRFQYTIQGLSQEGYILAVNNQLLLLDNNGLLLPQSAYDEDCINGKIIFESEKLLTFFLDTGKKAYVIAEDEEQNQSLYSVDLETFEYKLIKECERSRDFLWLPAEKILHVERDKAVTVKGNTVTIWNIDENDRLSAVREIALDESIVRDSCETDVAGDWLFIYEYDQTINADVLLYRININSGEVFYE